MTSQSMLSTAMVILALAIPSHAFNSQLISTTPHTFSTSTTLFSTTTPSKLPTNQDVRVVDSMPDPLPNPLKHNYYFLRHGQSTANVASIISSDRSLAYSDKHGLTPTGKQQGAQSAHQLLQALEQANPNPGEALVFVSSPFARARQTAEECRTELTNNPEFKERLDKLQLKLLTNDILLNEKLMERYFGRLDNEAIYTYAYVWPVDRFNVTHTAFEVESVAAVCTRLRELIVDDLEPLWPEQTKCHVVLTSHADVLQIGQLYAAGASNVGAFSSYRFGNGEVRAMQRTPDSLPPPVALQPPQRGTKPPPSDWIQ